MKVKAVIDGDAIKLKEPLHFKVKEFEVDIPDDYIQKEEKTEGTNFLESLWGTIRQFPEKNIDWKNEWYKHSEEKHG